MSWVAETREASAGVFSIYFLNLNIELQSIFTHFLHCPLPLSPLCCT